MVDDLIGKGLDEPYRLFTSRAEYRLLLGIDSVLPRLLPHGRRLGLIDEAEYEAAMRGRAPALARARSGCEKRRSILRPRVRAEIAAALGIEVDTPTTSP